MKNRVDQVNGYWSNPAVAAADPFTQSAESIAFYDSMMLLRRRSQGIGKCVGATSGAKWESQAYGLRTNLH